MDFKSIASDNTESGLLNSHTNSLSLSLSARCAPIHHLLWGQGSRRPFLTLPGGISCYDKTVLFFFFFFRLVSSFYFLVSLPLALLSFYFILFYFILFLSFSLIILFLSWFGSTLYKVKICPKVKLKLYHFKWDPDLLNLATYPAHPQWLFSFWL